MKNIIFHIDVNSAFLSWEAVYRLFHKGGTLDLREIPSAVGGDISLRHGIILAKSVPAKEYGIREGELVSSYMCQPETTAAEFEAAKVIYESVTGRSQPKDRDVTMYRVMQSFKPGEVTPETANKIGYELAMEFTKGQHQFVVYTHEDKGHIHNHIEINSTNLECNGKFKNVKDSVQVLRRVNDKICLAHGLSIPEPKRERALSQEEKGRCRTEGASKSACAILLTASGLAVMILRNSCPG